MKKRLSHATGMQLIALFAIVFAAVQWGSRDIRFGVAILFVAFIAFLAGRRELVRRRAAAPDCPHCNDTGMMPGFEGRHMVTLPAPCTHCDAGAKATARFRDVVAEMGGLPPAAPSGRRRVEVVADFLSSWRFCPVATSPTPSAACLEDAAQQLLDALDEAAT